MARAGLSAEALVEAAAALEPSFTLEFPKHDRLRSWPIKREEKLTSQSQKSMSQNTSQNGVSDKDAGEIVKEIGSSGWIRTSNPPVNSRMLYR